MGNGTTTEAQLDVDSFTLGSLFTPMQMSVYPSGGVYTPLPMQCCGDGFEHTLHVLSGKIPPNPLTRTKGFVQASIDNMLHIELEQNSSKHFDQS